MPMGTAAASSLDVHLRDKHLWIIRLRYLLSVVLAGSYILRVPLERLLTQSFSMLALAAIIMIVVAANFLWGILLKRGDMPLATLGYYQCIFDLIVASLIVHQYGAKGVVGYIFVFVILVAGILLQRRGIMLIAAAAGVIYLLLLLMEYYGYNVPLPPILGGASLLPPDIQFLLDVVIKVFFFFIIAIAAANMQDMVAKQARESDFLAMFNKEVIEAVPIGVMVLDLGRTIAVFNPAMEITSQVDSAKAMGMPIGDLFPGLDDSWFRAMDQVEETGEEVRLLGAVLPTAGGKQTRVNARLQGLRVNAAILATVVTIQTAIR